MERCEKKREKNYIKRLYFFADRKEVRKAQTIGRRGEDFIGESGPAANDRGMTTGSYRVQTTGE